MGSMSNGVLVPEILGSALVDVPASSTTGSVIARRKTLGSAIRAMSLSVNVLSQKPCSVGKSFDAMSCGGGR